MKTDVPAMLDFGIPSPARMYDYFLGGKDNFPADREAAEKVIAAYPPTRALALENRRFLERVVEYLASQGIRQFVDLGAGLPTVPNVHEVAQGIQPDARVAYVDNDPVVVVHSRALCYAENGVAVINGDIRRPQAILADPELTDLIDLSEPVAFLCVAVLHFVAEDENPGEIVAALRAQMAPGSYLVISHVATDGVDRRVAGQVTDVYARSTAPAVPRAESAIRDLFTGLDLVEPGLTDVARWRRLVSGDTGNVRILGGAGRKPVPA
jgi:O-methyltransferase involved in polyketide biosynthesis